MVLDPLERLLQTVVPCHENSLLADVLGVAESLHLGVEIGVNEVADALTLLLCWFSCRRRIALLGFEPFLERYLLVLMLADPVEQSRHVGRACLPDSSLGQDSRNSHFYEGLVGLVGLHSQN